MKKASIINFSAVDAPQETEDALSIRDIEYFKGVTLSHVGDENLAPEINIKTLQQRLW